MRAYLVSEEEMRALIGAAVPPDAPSPPNRADSELRRHIAAWVRAVGFDSARRNTLPAAQR